jgi:Na+-translocating ferredoxin:NAD+ oxidoreductase RnfG subunit
MKINLKNEYTIAAAKLALVAVVGILLVCIAYISLYSFSQKREKQKDYEINKKLFPAASTFTEKSFFNLKNSAEYFNKGNVKIKNSYYEAKDDNGELKGYIVFAYGSGFSAQLPLSIALTQTLQIHKVLLSSTNEVKGKLWEKDKSLSIFEGSDAADSSFPPIVSDRGEADSLSGATITFNGIVEAIKEVIAIFTNKGE